MTRLTGTGTLVRLILRRDRVRLAVWTAAIPLLVLPTAASVKGLYPTQADLDEAAAVSKDNAAAIAFNGPVQALDTLGGQIAFQVGSFGLVVVALMSIFTIARQTRAEEETGRTELILAMPVGPYAPAAAAMVVVAGMNALVGGAVTLGLIGMDLPTTGSVIFGATFAVLGLVFAAIALVAAQVSENTRVVSGASGAVLAVAFVVRAVGDIGGGGFSWFSPIGWVQKTRPFAGERWWPLLVAVAFTIAVIGTAVALAGRRDVGAGLVQPRPGPPSAAPGLGHPLGLALRLQRGSLIGWTAGVFLTGVAYGWVADDVEDFIGDNEALRDVIARAGVADLTDSYLARSLLIVALIGTGYAVQSTLRLRGEETGLRAEPVLATPVSRGRWAAGHLTVAACGAVTVLAAAGLGIGLVYAATTHDASQVPRLLGASLAYAPAVWLFIGLGTALFGLLPRATNIAWGALALCLVIGLLGEVLDLPGWFSGLSPFEYVPQVPAESIDIVPLAGLTALSAALTATGLAALRRRDVGY
ncbi:MAG TPA: ABC transporter permease [Yinghuangia sp.]|nr:ABC transporter permease [Yinghuangia sp.]